MYAALLLVPQSLIKKSGPYSAAVYDRNGMLLGAQVASDSQWRFESGAVPEKFARAIVCYEDRRFYWHPGVDPVSIARAAASNIASHRVVSGGSTLTMQTVRILEHNPPRTVGQKIHEAFLALLFELRFTKKQILELYAANAPFGGNVVGLEAASWRYFNRPPHSLTWAEAATLAVLPNQPALVHPGANRDILLKKRNALLKKLYEKKYLDSEQYSLALSESLPKKPYPLPQTAPHYLEYLKKHNPGSSKFYTSLDSSVQKNAVRIMEKWSEQFSRKEISNAAALILDTRTGKVLAYVGNTSPARNKTSWAVDLIQSRRSSGSLLKPFLYAAMLDNGMLLPKQIVPDVPTRIGNYRPDNNIPVYRGVIPADEALSRSLNIPAVKELQQYGIAAFLDYLRQCGFSTLNRNADYYGLPLILGGGEITLWEATHSYAAFMNRASQEKIPWNRKFPVSAGASYLTLNALSEGIRPDDEALWQSFASSRRIAWKTGTSSGNRDTWAIGTTSAYTVGVWIGNAGGQGNKELASITTAAPVLFDLFSVLPRSAWVDEPIEDLVWEEVCVHSGCAAGMNCAETKKELRPKRSPGGKLCPYCRTVTFTPDKKFQANVNDMLYEYAGKMPVEEKRFVLPPNLEYWYTRHKVHYSALPDFVPWHTDSDVSAVSIVFPNPGAQIIVPVEIDGKAGEVVLQAAARSAGTVLYWDMDGDFIGTTQHIHQVSVHLEAGEHLLTITDSTGTRVTRRFSVLKSE